MPGSHRRRRATPDDRRAARAAARRTPSARSTRCRRHGRPAAAGAARAGRRPHCGSSRAPSAHRDCRADPSITTESTGDPGQPTTAPDRGADDHGRRRRRAPPTPSPPKTPTQAPPAETPTQAPPPEDDAPRRRARRTPGCRRLNERQTSRIADRYRLERRLAVGGMATSIWPRPAARALRRRQDDRPSTWLRTSNSSRALLTRRRSRCGSCT